MEEKCDSNTQDVLVFKISNYGDIATQQLTTARLLVSIISNLGLREIVRQMLTK